jgi:hypothetical protein
MGRNNEIKRQTLSLSYIGLSLCRLFEKLSDTFNA